MFSQSTTHSEGNNGQSSSQVCSHHCSKPSFALAATMPIPRCSCRCRCHHCSAGFKWDRYRHGLLYLLTTRAESAGNEIHRYVVPATENAPISLPTPRNVRESEMKRRSVMTVSVIKYLILSSDFICADVLYRPEGYSLFVRGVFYDLFGQIAFCVRRTS